MKKIFILTAMMLAFSVISSAEKKEDSAEAFDRGIEKSTTCFIPKGAVGGGITFSYNDYNIGNAANDIGYTMLFSLIDGVKGNMTSFGVSPQVSYFVADNLSVGLMFDYERSRIDNAVGQLSLGDGMSFGVNDYNYFKHTYSGAVTCRYYMPLAKSKRFGMFAEVRAAGGYGQSESYRVENDEKFGTYQDIYKFSLGLVPGLSVFVTDEVALEVAIGILGLNWQKVEQTTNQVDKSVMTSSGANCNINLLSLEMGMSFYIPTGQHKNRKSR